MDFFASSISNMATLNLAVKSLMMIQNDLNLIIDGEVDSQYAIMILESYDIICEIIENSHNYPNAAEC